MVATKWTMKRPNARPQPHSPNSIAPELVKEMPATAVFPSHPMTKLRLLPFACLTLASAVFSVQTACADDLKKIIDAPNFKKLFGEFRDQEQLKSLPRDYAADNENISLLKLKSFAALHRLSDADIMKKDAPKKIAGVLANIYPLTVFLNNAIV